MLLALAECAPSFLLHHHQTTRATIVQPLPHEQTQAAQLWAHQISSPAMHRQNRVHKQWSRAPRVLLQLLLQMLLLVVLLALTVLEQGRRPGVIEHGSALTPHSLRLHLARMPSAQITTAA
jgi:hypothetical protein